ncbi:MULTISPECIES: GntR family transcriptional regulator [Kitasatospora]|uniref:Putative GntR family transcriptional regulator n=1 Tax=Kitasatospora setae (strain ATCC 33774 / DSM 43861 / JCM 3304 / KCC A-0304 / NBRC 14216 / KM-6054) TaxID=452652 RepID=E4NGP2_KITSK|nr:GntR family transcriptional regulator [Kitasatospora setae]BAJ30672.1 putative GntR family transcriptional regulator [Kitasatospora setae KM-6054]
MTIQRGTAPSPKYQRLAADLRRRIEAGEWEGGDRLPVENELEEQYQVARNTVRLAVDVLVNEGRVARVQGKGTYLRQPTRYDHRVHARPLRPARPGPLTPSGEVYAAEAAAAGRQLTVDFEVVVVQPRRDIAAWLGLRSEENVMMRRQLCRVDQEPYAIEESHYRAGLAAGTPLMENLPVPGGDERILAELGRTETAAVDHLTARMPSPAEAAWFGLGPGVPLLVNTRISSDRRGPIRVMETRYAADRARLLYELGDGAPAAG